MSANISSLCKREGKKIRKNIDFRLLKERFSGNYNK